MRKLLNEDTKKTSSRPRRVRDGSSVRLQGELVRDLREAMGLSQPQLSARSNGQISTDTVSRAERKVYISKAKARVLAGLLKSDLQRLLYDETGPVEGSAAIQQLVENAFLPAIYGALRRGDLDNASIWLRRACEISDAQVRDRLLIEEICLRRVRGKSSIESSFQKLIDSNSPFMDRARIEQLLVQFANRRSPTKLDPEALISGHLRRVACAVLGLDCISVGDQRRARELLEIAGSTPESLTQEAIHPALMLGVLCFALDDGKQGARYFEIARSEPEPDDVEIGYPFHFLLHRLSEAFVTACSTGQPVFSTEPDKPDPYLQSIRGQVWVTLRTAEIMLQSKSALTSFSRITEKWKTPDLRCTATGVAERVGLFMLKLRNGISGTQPLI